MNGTLQEFLSSYGLVVVLIGAFFEGESVVVMASFLAYQGILNPWGVGIASFLGSLASDQLLFILGRGYKGSKFVQRIVLRPTFATALRLIERHPTKFILTFRFLYGLRVVSPIAVGFTGLSVRRYAVLNGISAAIWAAFFTVFGVAFGHAIESVLGQIAAFESNGGIAVGIGLVVLIAIILITRWRRTHPPKDALLPPDDRGGPPA